MSRDAPRDRRWRDPRGTRRASVEFGGKSAGRKPREKRRPGPKGHRTVWQRQADRSRHLVRFGRRHKAGLLGWAGIVGALTCMWAFTGATQLLATGVSLGAAGVGGYLHHRERNSAVNGPNSRRASPAEVLAHHEAMLRTGRPASPQPERGADTVTVRSHSRDGDSVKTYTRAAPGKAKPTPDRRKSDWYDSVDGTKCRRCKGSGHNPDWDGKSPDCCSSCRGFGKTA